MFLLLNIHPYRIIRLTFILSISTRHKITSTVAVTAMTSLLHADDSIGHVSGRNPLDVSLRVEDNMRLTADVRASSVIADPEIPRVRRVLGGPGGHRPLHLVLAVLTVAAVRRSCPVQPGVDPICVCIQYIF